MDFLWDAITDWLKEILVSGIMSNLSGMFDSVNEKVGEISAQVGQTPQAWNSGIFNMVQSLSENVILPVAGVILAFVMTLELVQILMDKNNFHDDVCCKRCISSASNTTCSQLICGKMK